MTEGDLAGRMHNAAKDAEFVELVDTARACDAVDTRLRNSTTVPSDYKAVMLEAVKVVKERRERAMVEHLVSAVDGWEDED